MGNDQQQSLAHSESQFEPSWLPRRRAHMALARDMVKAGYPGGAVYKALGDFDKAYDALQDYEAADAQMRSVLQGVPPKLRSVSEGREQSLAHSESQLADYRKKPVVIQAVRWWQNGDHPNDGPPEWEGKVVRYFRHPSFPGEVTCSQCSHTYNEHGWIDTLEGGHKVCVGDWIIHGVQGETYPCKPDIFEATYEPA